ncbi:sulfite reductase (NADPH) flavoprotein alpha-component [Fibrisoma limi BUZ 3]|uniref:NADPH--hemoprotein reductase n=1 Tax=Fibrisoma limi BUZ 3 TaxID=1185876 RepID=I2GH35_9BACT|nr:PepSY domain-containing protein [Fibrisoma limi]CCH53210.1 sulfite reductase (NADPH) flavoprotein alpha-component [Fibrisoma limi BUZ 3]
MTISVWRYSHLALAVSSFLLLALASITGVILAFEPVSQKMQPYRVDTFSELTLAQTLPVLKKNIAEISELSVDANQFVLVKGSDENGKNLTAYVDPQTGKILGEPTEQSEFFQWATALHRSLFLKEIGRFFIGLTAFLLLLITVSGTMLIIQRQRGLKRFFTRIVRDNFAQYYHVVLGRLSLIPIFVIALSGTYLSLERFGLVNTEKISPRVNFDAIQSKPQRQLADFAVFNDIRLSEVQRIEFPFSDDVEDYYTLKLKDRELTVNQITGDILSDDRYPTAVLLTNLSLDLHTGRANALWAIILAVAAGNILFFIYSGFAITWKRRANRVRNNYSADESRFIILVGSENGSTFRFAQLIHQQLLNQGEKSFLTEFNKYTVFPKAEHLIALTATYGLGDAPTNARRFATLVEQYPQPQPVRYSVLGFGSHAYPDFCKFAFEVNQLLSRQSWAVPLVDIHTVNDKSPEEFGLWAEAWSQQTKLPMSVSSDLLKTPPPKLDTLTVTDNTRTAQPDGTFLVRLRANRRNGVTSGDLLAIYPANDHRERLYSIGVLDHELQLSVRLHPGGFGSGFLHELTPGQTIQARVVSNNHFHFPQKAPEVVMIANGTGIAPFLGMISENKQQIPCHLYCGFRQRASFTMYREFLEASQSAQQLTTLHVAYSREGDKQYVSNLLTRDADFIANVLAMNGVLMICGSLGMQKDVLELLETICQTKLGKSVSDYQSHSQILMDCY